MTAPARTVAAFDLDGTLTRRDTLVGFLRRLCGTAPTLAALAGAAGPLARAGGGSGARDAAKAAVLGRLLAGREVAAVELAGRAYAARVVARCLRPDVVAAAEAHRRAGHELVVVSASPEVYVAPVAELLGFHAALATRLEVEGGRLTGRLLGSNCRGAEKVARLRAWAGPAGAVVHAYGDSAGDDELLAAADVGRRVGRRPLPTSASFPPAPPAG